MARNGPRRERSVHANAFVEAGEFDAQLYAALRNSPWWMISIAAHVLLFVVSSLFQSNEPVVASKPPVDIAMSGAPDTPPEPEKPEADQDVESPTIDDVTAQEPVLIDKPDDQVTTQTDRDLPDPGTFGPGGPGDGDLSGISTNPLIGIGGGGKAPGFGNRGNGNGKGRPTGGTRRTEDSLEDALRWLAAHQSPDGAWEAEGFRKWCNGKQVSGEGPDGPGKAQYDVGVTGLALLAYLGAGYTHMSEGPFGPVVRNGLRWLRNAQDAEGCFGSRSTGHYVYNHSIAALAMVEAYALTGSANMRNSAQKSLDFIAITRNPYFAWRYGVKPGDNDTSVTGWMMMALKSAKLVNQGDVEKSKKPTFELDADAFEGIHSWVEKMTDPDTGRVGYQERGSGPARPTHLVDRFPSAASESMTAVGVLARIFLGENPKSSDAIKKGAKLMEGLLPVWDLQGGRVDMYYWYYATLAMFQVGGEPWNKWDAAMKTSFVDSQRKDGDYCTFKGSWDPVDPWGEDGGRVYSTAVMAMCLEVYYRYARVPGAISK